MPRSDEHAQRHTCLDRMNCFHSLTSSVLTNNQSTVREREEPPVSTALDRKRTRQFSLRKGKLDNICPYHQRCGMRYGRQLQYGCMLTLTEIREQHHLPIWELQRIVMGRGFVHIDLTEARKPLSNVLVGKNANVE